MFSLYVYISKLFLYFNSYFFVLNSQFNIFFNNVRTIHIPNILAKLNDHKVQQSKNKLQISKLYSNNDYVFCDNSSYHIYGKRPARNLNSILSKLNILFKFHRLRHTYVTRLFEVNVPPNTVQVFMQNYSISITTDIYTHVMEDTKLEVFENLNNIFNP